MMSRRGRNHRMSEGSEVAALRAENVRLLEEVVTLRAENIRIRAEAQSLAQMAWELADYLGTKVVAREKALAVAEILSTRASAVGERSNIRRPATRQEGP
jgi:hypothetical protein